MKFDRERDENPLYQRHNSNYGYAEGIASNISTLILYDINFLGNFKCDIYDVGNKRYITNEAPKPLILPDALPQIEIG